MDWDAWLEETKPAIREICNGGGHEVATPLRTAPETSAWAIACAVEEVVGVPAAHIMGKRRHKTVCDARRLAVKLAWEIWPERTNEDIARAFGVHHTSILGMRRHTERAGFRDLKDQVRRAL